MSDQISFENPIDIEQQDGIKKTDELEQDDISTVGAAAGKGKAKKSGAQRGRLKKTVSVLQSFQS